MSWKKWQQFIQRKGLEPRTNRRKFGILLFGASVFVFAVLAARMAYIVTAGEVAGTKLDEKTRELYQGSSVVKAKRGTIYDRNGFPIAEDATSYSLYAVVDENYLGIKPKGSKEQEKLYVQTKDRQAVARVLAANLKDITEAQVLDYFTIADDGKYHFQVEFGKAGQRLSFETKKKIEEELKKAEIKGIYFTENVARFYPNGVFASHLIGYLKIDDNNNFVPVMGIEDAYNKELSGQDGKVLFTKSFNQARIPNTEVVEKEAVDGTDIYTTLDSALQTRLEEVMDEVFKDYTPEDMTAMLVEAKTGNILAASQRKSFNPETHEGLADDDAEWKNLLVDYPIEPGSTMKVFTMAAAVETGAYDPNATVTTGSIDVLDAHIRDWNNGEGKGTIFYRQAFAWSSNVAMVKLQQQMGNKWFDYLKRFGFGQTTNSRLTNELPGIINSKNQVDQVMTAYGQAVSVTPFQMVQGFTAIANDGKMMKPNFVSKMVHADGTEEKIKPQEVGQPISAGTAHTVLDMMKDVVEDDIYGTGSAFKLDKYSVSAKTGTAQIVEGGVYTTTKFINSVVAIVPTENPEFIMYVTIRKPVLPGDEIASNVVAKITKPVLERALNVDAAHQLDDDE